MGVWWMVGCQRKQSLADSVIKQQGCRDHSPWYPWLQSDYRRRLLMIKMGGEARPYGIIQAWSVPADRRGKAETGRISSPG